MPDPASALERSVLRALGGASASAVAAEDNLEPGLLRAAVEAYRAAGRLALAELGDDRWEYWRVEVAAGRPVHDLVASRLAPVLDRLTGRGVAEQWWFVVKHDDAPHVRLRLFAREPARTAMVVPVVEDALEALRGAGHLSAWRTIPYEPETVLFGGPEGMRLSHALLAHDSRHACRWLAAAGRPSWPRERLPEASVVAIRALLSGAGLDVFEQGDVWERAASHRPVPAGRLDAALRKNRDAIGRLYLAGEAELRELLGDSGAYELLEEWAVDLRRAGGALARASRDGRLRRGLRAVLATHLVFHWNRLGLAGPVQAGLAHLVADWIFDEEEGPLGGPDPGGAAARWR